MGDGTLAVSAAGAGERDGEVADKLTAGSRLVGSHSLGLERSESFM